MARCKGPGRSKRYTGEYRNVSFADGRGGTGYGRHYDFEWIPCTACGKMHGWWTSTRVFLGVVGLAALVLGGIGLSQGVKYLQERSHNYPLEDIPKGDHLSPADFGDDETLWMVTDDCESGIMGGCELVFASATAGSVLADWAQACGGRIEPPNGAPSCISRFAAEGAVPLGVAPGQLGSDQEMDSYALSCRAGNFMSCDIMYGYGGDSDYTAYATYGGSCGGRDEPTDESAGSCYQLYYRRYFASHPGQ